ncbi:MAG TPA: hypothetical protein VLJ76_11790 [Gaiellaceae bacterium]|nr:hypothetical protein [Gaiellaceae bacterium]
MGRILFLAFGITVTALAVIYEGWVWLLVPVAGVASAHGFRWAFRLLAHRDPPGWPR